MSACLHVRSELRVLHKRDGDKLYGYQCLDCGGACSKWYSHDSPLVRNRKLPPWDDSFKVYEDPRQGRLF